MRIARRFLGASSAILAYLPLAQADQYSAYSALEKLAARQVEGKPATSVSLAPLEIGADGAGNLFVLDEFPRRVLRIGAGGNVQVVFGGGTAQSNLRAMAVDATGNVFLSDSGRNQVLRVGTDGVLTIVAGTGEAGFSGDGGPAIEARLDWPGALCLAPSGELYFVDSGNNRLRAVTLDGTIRTIGGFYSGMPFGGGSSMPTMIAENAPSYIAADARRNLYMLDWHRSHNVIERLNLDDGTKGTLGRNGRWSSEGGPFELMIYWSVYGLVAAPDGTLYVSDAGGPRMSPSCALRKFSPGGAASIVVGGCTGGISGDEGPPEEARLSFLGRVTVNGSGDIWFVDYHVVRRISGGVVRSVAGSHSAAAAGEGGPLADSSLRRLASITSDSWGNYYFSDRFTHSVYKAPPDLSSITRIAGTGYPGYTGDRGPGTEMALNYPCDLQVDSSGNVYIADRDNRRIHKLTPSGELETVAGTWFAQSRDFSEGINALLVSVYPENLRLHRSGDLFFMDSHRVFRLTPAGSLHSFTGDLRATSGDGRLAAETRIGHPCGMDFDSKDNAYVADQGSNSIRMVSGRDGLVSTVAGTGLLGYSGDGGPAKAALLQWPCYVRVDSGGNVLFVDSGNHRLRRITVEGVIQTIAGGGDPGVFEDGLAATAISVSSYGAGYQITLHAELSGRIWLNDAQRLIRLEPKTPDRRPHSPPAPPTCVRSGCRHWLLRQPALPVPVEPRSVEEEQHEDEANPGEGARVRRRGTE